MKKLENKTVSITGRLSSIGKPFAINNAKENSNILVAVIKSETTNKAMAEIKKASPNAVFIECDASLFSQIQIAIEKVLADTVRLEIATKKSEIIDEKAVVKDLNIHSDNKVIGWG